MKRYAALLIFIPFIHACSGGGSSPTAPQSNESTPTPIADSAPTKSGALRIPPFSIAGSEVSESEFNQGFELMLTNRRLNLKTVTISEQKLTQDGWAFQGNSVTLKVSDFDCSGTSLAVGIQGTQNDYKKLLPNGLTLPFLIQGMEPHPKVTSFVFPSRYSLSSVLGHSTATVMESSLPTLPLSKQFIMTANAPTEARQVLYLDIAADKSLLQNSFDVSLKYDSPTGSVIVMALKYARSDCR